MLQAPVLVASCLLVLLGSSYAQEDDDLGGLEEQWWQQHLEGALPTCTFLDMPPGNCTHCAGGTLPMARLVLGNYSCSADLNNITVFKATDVSIRCDKAVWATRHQRLTNCDIGVQL